MAPSGLVRNLKIVGASHRFVSLVRRGFGLMLLFVPLLWTGCGETRTPAQPTAGVPAASSVQADPRAGAAVVVAGTGAMLGDDGYVLNAASVAGDTLTVSVSYGGGCETHAFTLVISASFIESSPVQFPDRARA